MLWAKSEEMKSKCNETKTRCTAEQILTHNDQCSSINKIQPLMISLNAKNTV